jgi:hypothetical protein
MALLPTKGGLGMMLVEVLFDRGGGDGVGPVFFLMVVRRLLCESCILVFLVMYKVK